MKWFLTFVVCLMSMAQAQSTTQPVVYIRDTTAKADTQQKVVNGSTLYLASLPKNWTLDFNFGKPVKSAFSVDGGAVQQYWAPNYSPTGHNTPLVLAVGSHTIAVKSNGVDLPPFEFNLQLAPAATPTDQLAGAVWGWNIPFGANNAGADLTIHTPIATTLTACKTKVVRLWFEDDQFDKNGDNYWVICRKYKAAGYKVLLEYQGYQYASPKFSMPPDARLAIVAKGVAAGHAVDYFCLGNEVNTGAYFSGTYAQMAHAEVVMSPLLHAGGVLLIAPSMLNSTAAISQLVAADGWNNKYVDGVDYHSYQKLASSVISNSAPYFEMASQQGFNLVFESEWGTRDGPDVPTWAGQQQAVLTAWKTLPVIVIPFPMVDSGDALDTTYPLDANYQQTAYYPYWVKAMGN